MKKIQKQFKETIIFIDQIIVSGSNFLLSIIILRYLGIKVFGLFSFLWLFVLLINSIQNSYIISPMLTNAPKQDMSKINYFYGGILCQQILFSFIIFFLINVIGKNYNSYFFFEEIKNYVLPFSLIVLITQFHQFFRRILFSKSLNIRATICDLVTYLLLILIIVILNYINKFNLETLLYSFVFSFLFGTLFTFSIIFSLNFNFKETKKSIIENWIIGKWLLATSLLQWFSGNLWIINTGIILGPYTLGIVRACQTLLNFTNVIFQSFENYVPGSVSEKYKSGGIKEMQKYIKDFTIKYSILIILTVFLVSILSKFLLSVFYGLETANYYKILIFLSFLVPIYFLQYGLNYGLRTLSKTKPIFISYVFAAFFSLVTSKFIITNYKVDGLIFGLYITQIIIISILYLRYHQIIKKNKG